MNRVETFLVRDFVLKFLREKIPQVDAIETEGTYLMWLNFKKLGLTQEELKEFIFKKAKVGLQDGRMFGEEGRGFMRMNIGCPRVILKEALQRLETAIKNR